jgi:PadR family transcriptional regulator, regulatory protein PadR
MAIRRSSRSASGDPLAASARPEPRTDGQVLKGLLDTLVLRILEESDNYGFGILQRLRELLDGKDDVLRDATLYPLLHRLEARGFVESYFEPGERGTPRKYYRITDDGRIQLDERTADWRRVVRILQKTIFER